MRRIASTPLIVLAGCATLRDPAGLDTGTELGVFVAPAPARFSEQPQAVVHDGDAVERRAPIAPAATEANVGDGSVVGGVGRVGVILAHHLVAGLEIEGGSVRSAASDAATTSSAIHLGGAAVIGLTARRDGFSVGGELVAGLRKLERHSEDGDWFFVQSDGFVEARLRAHVWIASWLAVGAYVAFDEAGMRGGGIRIIGSIPDSQRRKRR